MRRILLPLFMGLIFVVSCKKEKESFPVTSFEVEIEMKKWDSIYTDFKTVRASLAAISATQPEIVLSKTDSLLVKYTSDVNIVSDLHHFRAEIFYGLGEYEKSLAELAQVSDVETNVEQLCNYVQLKREEKVQSLLTEISKNGIGYDDFVYANYLEVTADTAQALATYHRILADKTNQRFPYYTLTVQREAALSSASAELLKSMYFPTRLSQ